MFDRVDDANTVLPIGTINGEPLFPIPGSSSQANPAINGPIQLGYWEVTPITVPWKCPSRKIQSRIYEGSFTWGNNIDTGSAVAIPDPYTNSLAGNFWFCEPCRRGLSDFNIAKNLTINLNYDVPAPNHWGNLAAHVLGGWELEPSSPRLVARARYAVDGWRSSRPK